MRRVDRIYAHLLTTPPTTPPATFPRKGVVAAAAPRQLSAQQLDEFRARGFLLLRQWVPEHELVEVTSDSAALIERGRCGPFGDERWNFTSSALDPAGRAVVPSRINQLQDPDMPLSFQMLLAYPPLLSAAAQLMAAGKGPSASKVACNKFACAVQAMVFKMPFHSIGVPWHQDPVNIVHVPAFNVDVYLDKVNLYQADRDDPP
jgi:hypothetical protein